jgi:phosphoribosylanthranilate isomerase
VDSHNDNPLHGQEVGRSSSGVLINGLLFLASVVIALCVGEGAVRIIYPQELGNWTYTRDGLTLHLPNMTQWSHRFGHIIKTNSVGMRDYDHSLGKSPGVYRILVLGDSFMEANQVKFEDAFVSLLERQLGGVTGHSIEVVNASVSGWGTDDELMYLMREGLRYRPDLVLVGMTLHNDVQDNQDEEFHVFTDGHLQENPRPEMSLGDFALLQMKEFLASHSHLYQVLLRAKRFSSVQQEGNRLSSHVASLIKKQPTPEVVQAWDMTRHLFRKMKVESLKQGANVAVFLIPLWVQVSEERLKEFLTEHQLSIEQIALDQPQSYMKAIGQEEQIEIIDLLPDFQRAEKEDSQKLYLLDDGHWKAEGHRLAASVVRERLNYLVGCGKAYSAPC